MASMRNAISLLIYAGVLLCAAAASAENSSAGITRTSRPVRLLRSWEDTIKASGGREFARRVDVIFDYSKGYAYEVTFNSQGHEVGRQRLGAGHPAPSREEIDEAFAFVRGEPSFQRIFQRFDVVLEGGFVLLETADKRCGPGARCLRVFLLSSDRAGTIRQAVVDLVKREVVYPDFVPEPWRAPK
jgi:hypothetical protein